LCLIYWKSISEWGQIIYKWASNSGYNSGTLCTVYELIEGNTGEGELFFQMDIVLFIKCIKFLEKNNKANYYQKNKEVSMEDGVKFL
jgi:ESCRT-II complex subunit VPS25